jgi:PleD family two-component response regulator
MTISLGVAVADTNTPTTYEQLRDIAADALREAKQTGRNRAVVRVIAAPPTV